MTGAFTLHVPAAADIRLDAVRIGEAIVSMRVGIGVGPIAITMPQLGTVRVTATEGATQVPVRIQIVPANGQAVPVIPGRYGEREQVGGRQLVTFAPSGTVTVSVPPGRWEVIVSRGYEYELVRQNVTVTAGNQTIVDAIMDRSVATIGDQCGDFHIHTWRSNDSA